MRTNKSGKYGIKLGASDRMTMIVDLMNESNTPQVSCSILTLGLQTHTVF